MKTFSSGLCVSLLWLSWTIPVGAQQQPPATPPATTPPAAAPPSATQATPPQEQTPPPEQPRTGIRPTPPTLPKIPDVRQPGETGYWIGISGWFPTQEPEFNKGRGAAFTTASLAPLAGKPKAAYGAEVGLALGLHNALRLSYFQSQASGNFTKNNDLQIYDQTYVAGTLVASDYKLENIKLSFDYLTWPYPVESRRFRLKTLWGLQYTSIRSTFDAPFLPLFDAATGAPLVDASGNPISYVGTGTRWFVSPILGIGVSQFVSRHFRVEANASGFTIPRHNSIWDADASANIRYGHIELRLGGKAFHFKTTTNSDFYMKNTMGSAFVGLRWYSQ